MQVEEQCFIEMNNKTNSGLFKKLQSDLLQWQHRIFVSSLIGCDALDALMEDCLA